MRSVGYQEVITKGAKEEVQRQGEHATPLISYSSAYAALCAQLFSSMTHFSHIWL